MIRISHKIRLILNYKTVCVYTTKVNCSKQLQIHFGFGDRLSLELGLTNEIILADYQVLEVPCPALGLQVSTIMPVFDMVAGD